LQLKVVREQRQQQEEKLALMELRRVVEQMQGVEQERSAQEEAVRREKNTLIYFTFFTSF
jgi:hypothetical protein